MKVIFRSDIRGLVQGTASTHTDSAVALVLERLMATNKASLNGRAVNGYGDIRSGTAIQGITKTSETIVRDQTETRSARNAGTHVCITVINGEGRLKEVAITRSAHVRKRKEPKSKATCVPLVGNLLANI